MELRWSWPILSWKILDWITLLSYLPVCSQESCFLSLLLALSEVGREAWKELSRRLGPPPATLCSCRSYGIHLWVGLNSYVTLMLDCVLLSRSVFSFRFFPTMRLLNRHVCYIFTVKACFALLVCMWLSLSIVIKIFLSYCFLFFSLFEQKSPSILHCVVNSDPVTTKSFLLHFLKKEINIYNLNQNGLLIANS